MATTYLTAQEAKALVNKHNEAFRQRAEAGFNTMLNNILNDIRGAATMGRSYITYNTLKFSDTEQYISERIFQELTKLGYDCSASTSLATVVVNWSTAKSK
jgi:hypothetical protein